MPEIKKFTPQQRLKAIARYNQEYKRKHYKAITFQVSLDKCSDVLQKLDSVPNKVDYIVGLIRADIIKNGIK